MLLGKVTSVQPPQVEHGNDVVKVIVGPLQREFTIHKNLICATSDFFQAALTGGFVEGAEQKVPLPEDDPQLFQVVYDWLCSGRLGDGASTYLKKEDVCAGDIFWWKLYQMGDRLMMDRLRVLAIDQIQKLFTTTKPLIPSKIFIEGLFEDGRLPSLETYMVEHVVYWLERSADPSVWKVLPAAHPRFSQALAENTILALKFNTIHPSTYTGVLKVDGYLSPWKIAGVAGAPTKDTGGGTQVREKHLKRAKMIVPKVKGKLEDAVKDVARVGQDPETSTALPTDAPPAEPLKLKTSDGRILVPLYFPKDGLLNEFDLKFLLRKAYDAAGLNSQTETAAFERFLCGLGLIDLSQTIQSKRSGTWNWTKEEARFTYKVWGARWDRVDNYWADQGQKALSLTPSGWEDNANADGWDTLDNANSSSAAAGWGAP
ncbi:hypothetical protein H2200_005055 [Cladophialophora chaetospira]|uniref:BTB domain-containing protein n=1 Tax=Cladophialophora chaetospira TaxID=386627 RepID=A0AA38XB85_9EURO|nr:hypothetical protein H2200_005055 [Cladophialophora chaetospira]